MPSLSATRRSLVPTVTPLHYLYYKEQGCSRYIELLKLLTAYARNLSCR